MQVISEGGFNNSHIPGGDIQDAFENLIFEFVGKSGLNRGDSIFFKLYKPFRHFAFRHGDDVQSIVASGMNLGVISVENYKIVRGFITYLRSKRCGNHNLVRCS